MRSKPLIIGACGVQSISMWVCLNESLGCVNRASRERVRTTDGSVPQKSTQACGEGARPVAEAVVSAIRVRIYAWL